MQNAKALTLLACQVRNSRYSYGLENLFKKLLAVAEYRDLIPLAADAKVDLSQGNHDALVARCAERRQIRSF